MTYGGLELELKFIMDWKDTFIESFDLYSRIRLALVEWEQLSEWLQNLSLSDPYKVYLDDIILVAWLNYESIWTSFILFWQITSYIVQILETFREKYRVLRVFESAPNFLIYGKSISLF